MNRPHEHASSGCGLCAGHCDLFGRGLCFSRELAKTGAGSLHLLRHRLGRRCPRRARRRSRHPSRYAGCWSIPSGIPLFAYSFSYDALAGFFNLTLAILAIAVSIYSFGYLKEFEGKRNIGFFGFLFHLLLLSLTIVFTAANAFLFLIAWEVMALAAYGLVTFYHEDRESRRAGLLYIIMAHIDCRVPAAGFCSVDPRQRQRRIRQLPRHRSPFDQRPAGRRVCSVLPGIRH